VHGILEITVLTSIVIEADKLLKKLKVEAVAA